MIKDRSKTEHIIIHATGTVSDHPKTFFSFATLSRKFGYMNIGHHKVIIRDGTIIQGRRDEQCGGHLKGFNHNSLSILLVGGMAVLGPNYTEEQWESLCEVLIQAKEAYPDASIRGAGEVGRPRGQDRETPYFNVSEYLDQIGLEG